MSKFKITYLEKVRDSINMCTMCGLCKSVCPSFKSIGWDSALPKGRIILAYGLLNGDLEADESTVRNMYMCTTCADCVRRCPSKVDVVKIIELCRTDIVRNRVIIPKHKMICDNIITTGNPFGERSNDRFSIIRPHRASIGYYMGCNARYRLNNIAQAAVSILDKLCVDYTIINETCCGSIMQRIGWPERDLINLITKNVEMINNLGIETLVVSCAGCYKMFKFEYPKYIDVPFEVLHITEYLSKKDLNLRSMNNTTVTYHDPCHLGRHCGVYEAPRKVISMIPGIEFKEMKYSREASHCCGGGGGVRQAYIEEAVDIASTRIKEADFADLMITACPFCVSNLNYAKGNNKIQIVDIVEIINSLME